MKKIGNSMLLCGAALCLASASAWAQQCAALPAEPALVMEESVIALGVQFEVSPPEAADDAPPRWTLEQEILSWGDNFVLRDPAGAVAASCGKRILALTATTDVLGCRGEPLFTISENWTESLLKVVTNHEVHDARGQLMMESRKVEWWLSGAEMTFTRQDRPVGRAERDWPSFWGDTWVLSTSDGDPKTMLALLCSAAHKTLRDHQESSSSSS